MANTDYTKERIALFTKYFFEVNKPISVQGLIKLFEDYSGGVVFKRQTIYNDLAAMSIVLPLTFTKKRGEYQRNTPPLWYMMEKVK